MNNLFYNKKGDNVLSIWWFGILVFVGGGIVFGALLFYGAYVDVRLVESEILNNKISNCLVSDNVFDQEILNKDFLNECNLNQELFQQGSKYFIKVDFDNQYQTLKFGNNALEIDCGIKKKILKANEFPDCTTNKLNVMDLNGNDVEIIILTGSNNDGKPN